MTARRRVVCTAILGGYEALLEQPVARQSELDFVCFTDDPALASDTWRIRHVTPYLPMDLVRSVRHLKMRTERYLDDVAETLWIDNTVTLLVPPEQLLDDWLDGADVAAPLHSFRASALDEFNAVAALQLDDPHRVYEQLVHYASTDPGALDDQPHWLGILARRRSDRTEALMERWWEHVLRFSRRDQLSFPYVVRSADVALASVPIDNHESAYHRWPAPANRLPEELRRRFAGAFVPPLAEARAASERIAALEAEAAHRLAELEEARSALSDAARRRDDALARAEAQELELAEVRAQLEQAEERLAVVLGSRSWRAAALLRWASAARTRVRPLKGAGDGRPDADSDA